MKSPKVSLNVTTGVAQIILNILVAIPSIGIGAMTLISPDVPAGVHGT